MALTTLATNNILKWSGSKWVNNTLAQAGIATPADISTAIDGIEIGGRNLAEYGNWLISNGVAVGNHTFTLSASTGSSSIRQRGGSLKLEPNTNYVFSFRVRKLSGNFNKIGGHISPNFINNSPTYIDGSDVGYNYSSPLIHEPLNDGEWHKVVAHLKTTATINDTGLLYIQPNRSTYEAVSVEIKDLMFEKGNKATDWSPAPEDQVTDWNVTDVNSFAFLKNKPTKLTLTGAVTGNTTLSSGELSLNTSLTAHNHTWTQITGTIPT